MDNYQSYCEKRKLLHDIHDLEKKGIKRFKHCTMNDSLEELTYALFVLQTEFDKKADKEYKEKLNNLADIMVDGFNKFLDIYLPK